MENWIIIVIICTMAEFFDAVDKYEGLMRVPRAGGIHDYISGLGMRVSYITSTSLE
jgi:hypothetical protein